MTAMANAREHVIWQLEGGHAHLGFEEAVADFPAEAMNQRPPNVSYTPWHLLEHMRLSQWDILEFTVDPDHISPQWPKEYWPGPDAETDEAGWEETLAGFRSDYERLLALARDPQVDLTAPLPHAPNYTVLRELLLAADHNAYHIGEFAILRQVMGTWPADRDGS